MFFEDYLSLFILIMKREYKFAFVFFCSSSLRISFNCIKTIQNIMIFMVLRPITTFQELYSSRILFPIILIVWMGKVAFT